LEALDRFAEKADVALRRLQQADKQTKQRCFAGAVRSDQTDKVPLKHGERQVVDYFFLLIQERQPIDLDHDIMTMRIDRVYVVRLLLHGGSPLASDGQPLTLLFIVTL